jgi:hypothetical protein
VVGGPNEGQSIIHTPEPTASRKQRHATRPIAVTWCWDGRTYRLVSQQVDLATKVVQPVVAVVEDYLDRQSSKIHQPGTSSNSRWRWWRSWKAQ